MFPDYIICLEDGKKFKSLKRHLDVHYGLTPDGYRNKWGLKPNYPMVAPNYAAQRSALAKSSGLGRKPAAKPAKKVGSIVVADAAGTGAARLQIAVEIVAAACSRSRLTSPARSA